MTYGKMLVEWFLKNKRQMPWRNTTDPYAIWVSEVMLQQTQVDTVIPYYLKFMERFKTVEDLAGAQLEEVFNYWQGLGYYRRAENLQKGAKLIVSEFGGIFPKDPKLVEKIPSVGDYTLGAVLSIAFHLPFPAVDGNVMRILSRQFLIKEDIAIAKSKRVFKEKVMELMTEDPNPFNQGLMELGALICTPKNPKCTVCPVKTICKAYEQNKINDFPVKSKKIKVKLEKYKLLVIRNENTYWMEKRPEEGLLANLWGFPMIETESWEEDRMTKDIVCKLKNVKHVFTHRKWEMEPLLIEYSDLYPTMRDYIERTEGRFLALEEMEQYPIGTAFKKIILELEK